MNHWQATFLGSHRFPRELSSFLVWRFFTLSSDDRLELRRRFRSRSRLGAALQLGFVRMTGTTLDALDYVPRSVLGRRSRMSSIESARAS